MDSFGVVASFASYSTKISLEEFSRSRRSLQEGRGDDPISADRNAHIHSRGMPDISGCAHDICML
jgi:hypothetical protein